MTPTIELICGHRSIRHFTDEPISEAQREAIINSARATSSSREGANKQVISSQADSLIKISRIWADFFPANTSNQPI